MASNLFCHCSEVYVLCRGAEEEVDDEVDVCSCISIWYWKTIIIPLWVGRFGWLTPKTACRIAEMPVQITTGKGVTGIPSKSCHRHVSSEWPSVHCGYWISWISLSDILERSHHKGVWSWIKRIGYSYWYFHLIIPPPLIYFKPISRMNMFKIYLWRQASIMVMQRYTMKKKRLKRWWWVLDIIHFTTILFVVR